MSTIATNDENIDKANKYISEVVNKNQRPFYVSNIKKNNISLKTVLHSYLLYYKHILDKFIDNIIKKHQILILLM